ncbi:hypothetical protein ABIB50_001961 [Mucilaginibacter sp. UYCu711]
MALKKIKSRRIWWLLAVVILILLNILVDHFFVHKK